MRAHRRGLAAAAVAVLALLGAPLPAGATAAGATVAAAPAEDVVEPSLRVVIDSLAPAAPEDGDSLRLRGRVISTSREVLTDVSVQLRRSSAPASARRDVALAAEAPLDPVAGEPADVPLPGTRVPVADALPAGASRPFAIRVPIDALGLTAPGSYVLGVDALGREQGVDEFDTRKGVVRTFLPWFPADAEVEPVNLVWLWPLADWPARGTDGALLDDRTPEELSPGGRLDRLLGVGSRFRSTVSWVADPALLQTAAAMTDGYQVVQDGTLTVGDREEQAGRWLDALARATRGAGMRGLPYADIDASAITRGGLSNDVVRAVTQGPGISAAALGQPVEGDLYWAPFGRIDRPALNVLASAGVTTIVLSADAMPPTDQATPIDGLATASLPTSVGTIRAVLTDPGLTATLGLPLRSSSDVILARQRFLAETAVLAQTLPAGQRDVVVAPGSVRWDAPASLLNPLLRATESTPWLRPRTLARLLDDPAPSASRQRGGYGERAREAELSADYVARIARTETDVEVFASVIDDPTGIVQPFSEALLRAGSSAWRTEPATGERLLAGIAADISDETARVRVLSEGRITFSGDMGKVPITITNELDRSVTVGVVLRGNPALRLTSEPLTGIRIEPGRFASVDIDARVVGGDPLAVDVQLVSPEGEDYGTPARITLTSTAYARAAAWVVVAAFVAIAVFVVVGVTRRIRKAHAARAGSNAGQ